MEKRFESKIDGWLIIVFLVSVVSTLIAGVGTILAGGSSNLLIGLAVIFIGTGLPIWLYYSTAYIVTKKELKVRCGPVRMSILLADIKRVEKTRNPLSSPALSLDRLKISYGQHKTVMISPKDKAGFLKAIGHSLTE